ncbi:MAG TPA: hypothetical protein VGM01_11815 [Ktedonobacteraceae bacterium]|jgi:hypothetical protein
MFKKSYRKSPGRQYGYDYNPLNEQGRIDTAHPHETWNEEEGDHKPSRPGALVPRPDPRRTRQLIRQNILASKNRSTEEQAEEFSDEIHTQTPAHRYHRHAPTATSEHGYYDPQPYREFEDEQIAEDWIEHGESEPTYMDPDLGFDEEQDPLAQRVRPEPAPARGQAAGGARSTRRLPERDDDDGLLEEELEQKRRKAGRRKFLLGAAVVTGTAVAAYELVPRIPQAVSNGASNIEHQLQQAFQNGVASGAEAARKDLINSLDTLEGFSLEGAISAAKLTRIAYDVFVSPLVTLAANVADDFLSVTLKALITGRKWLAQINEDSPTLAALQTVLQSWVDQASAMPKKVQAITDSDLDGAQSYLRALQRKIQAEQAQLNGQGTPTPGATTNATPTPKK